ncbi:DUF4355 domain-containing protein [Lentilactobacillus sp. SPB1-3]|uniref:DUF4355 domain-containing protein n=1 Tax=Lentilactobacillus terminaliae TaxID=3003483 RepID=A0ACD5DCY0_9LACO|nr:DUF4355 domain-containing protein [Lentilactobacillus sp. SPB1-3]MCZ0978034.1 DUF4355 domain-containing protein [Lentilactobacillus sp. SPB1-3]
MKRFDNLMPMQLQYFAENDQGTDDANDNVNEPLDNAGSENNSDDAKDDDDHEENDDDPSKVIEKLQGRIGKEQGKKNELQQQLDKAQAELKKLRGGKDAKEPDKTPEQIEVEKLRMQLERRDILDSTLDVFKESKIDVPKDIVELFISDDRDQTIDNAGKLLNYVTSIKKDTEASVRSEYAGGKVPKSTKHINNAGNFGTQVAKSGNDRIPLQSNYSN